MTRRVIPLLASVASAALIALAPLPAGAEGPAKKRAGSSPSTSTQQIAAAAPSVAAPAAQQIPFQPYDEERPILAYYYSWWDPHNFGRTLYQPTEWYNSDDEGVMRRHILQAREAGIDGFVFSWMGIGNRTDVNFQRLLELGRESGFRSTIHFETHIFADYGVEDVILHLKLFVEQRANHPSMVTFQGRPVIFFWRAGLYDNATWDYIRAQADPERKTVWIADGDQFNILSGGAWDGISPYAIAWSNAPRTHLSSWAASARRVAPDKLFIPPVSPGCDDRAARPATCIQDRADGTYYQATLEGAMLAQPNWAVIVSTFNEWMESTQIEPSAQYGDLYLQMTRWFADQFKAR